MITGRGTWPVLLADLSLILFVATAVQASHSAAKAAKRDEARPAALAPAAPGIPQAYYLAEPGAPPISQWIAEQGLGDEARVTILSSYRPGGAEAALDRAADLARDAASAGKPPRVLIEPGDGSTRAILSYDRPQGALGR